MMRVLALLFAIVFLCSGALAQTLSPQAFTEQFAKALAASMPAANVAVAQELRLMLKRGDGTSAEVNLANVYGEYKASPERFSELVGKFAAALKGPAPAKLERARIVPVIKDRAWLDETAPLFRAQGAELLFEDFNKELVVAYAEDSATRSRYLSSRDDVGDRKSLRALAVDNLRNILPKIEMRQFGEALAAISAGGSYEPSLLLFDEIWTGGQIKVEGDTVIAIPARDTLLITGSKSRKGLKVMRDIVKETASGPYRLTDALFVYRQGRFVKFGRN